MKKENLEPQPFTLNHKDGNMSELTGKTPEELTQLTLENVKGDYPFAVMLLGTIFEMPEAGALASVLMGGVLGERIERPTKLVEYVVRTIPEGNLRDDVYTVCANINPSRPSNGFEGLDLEAMAKELGIDLPNLSQK